MREGGKENVIPQFYQGLHFTNDKNVMLTPFCPMRLGLLWYYG